jgi:hypothetical protein
MPATQVATTVKRIIGEFSLLESCL